MKQKELEKLAQSLAKNIKTEADLSKFSSQLMKMTVEAVQIGYTHHETL